MLTAYRVREGMVFVTMDHDEVLERTAQYQIQYAPAASLENACDDDDDDVDDDDSTRPTISIRHDNDGTSTRVRRSGLYRGEVLDEYRAAQMPPEFCLSRPNVGVSTQCDDDPILARSNHLFPEAHGSRRRAHAHRPAPNHIGPLPFESFDPDEDYEQPDYYNEMLDGIRPSLSQQQPPQTTPSFDPANPWGTDVGGSSLSLDETRRAHGNATHRAPSAAGGELLAPHARFLIEKRKSMCTIRFDPPVTGRFILLKVWNSHQDPTSNIDIQSVVVKGFSGPRFFPSVQLR